MDTNAVAKGVQRTRRALAGVVPNGTSGIYDKDPKVRTITARKMVQSRTKVWGTCKAPGCLDPETGQPKKFYGYPNKEVCSTGCGMRKWRHDQRELGYKEVTRNGLHGWETPTGVFIPSPSQPQKVRRQRRSRQLEARREVG